MASRPSQGEGNDASIDDQLFGNMRFFLAADIPLRNHYKAQIERNGGIVVIKQDSETLTIIDDLKRRNVTQPGTYSYKYIDACVRTGILQDRDGYQVVPPSSSSSSNGAGAMRHVRADGNPRGKARFTHEEDVFLYDFMTEYLKGSSAREKGNAIYKQIEQMRPRHTFHSWRDRWLKRISLEGRPVPLQDSNTRSPVNRTAPAATVQDPLVTEPAGETTENLRGQSTRRMVGFEPAIIWRPPPIRTAKETTKQATPEATEGATEEAQVPRDTSDDAPSSVAPAVPPAVPPAIEPPPNGTQEQDRSHNPDNHMTNSMPVPQTTRAAVPETRTQEGGELETDERASAVAVVVPSHNPTDEDKILTQWSEESGVNPTICTEADKGAILGSIKTIVRNLPHNSDWLWSQFAQIPGNEHHTPAEWEQIWIQVIEPTLVLFSDWRNRTSLGGPSAQTEENSVATSIESSDAQNSVKAEQEQHRTPELSRPSEPSSARLSAQKSRRRGSLHDHEDSLSPRPAKRIRTIPPETPKHQKARASHTPSPAASRGLPTPIRSKLPKSGHLREPRSTQEQVDAQLLSDVEQSAYGQQEAPAAVITTSPSAGTKSPTASAERSSPPSEDEPDTSQGTKTSGVASGSQSTQVGQRRGDEDEMDSMLVNDTEFETASEALPFGIDTNVNTQMSEKPSSPLTATTPGNTAPVPGISSIPSQRSKQDSQNQQDSSGRSYIRTTQPGFTSQPDVPSSTAGHRVSLIESDSITSSSSSPEEEEEEEDYEMEDTADDKTEAATPLANSLHVPPLEPTDSQVYEFYVQDAQVEYEEHLEALMNFPDVFALETQQPAKSSAGASNVEDLDNIDETEGESPDRHRRSSSMNEEEEEAEEDSSQSSPRAQQSVEEWIAEKTGQGFDNAHVCHALAAASMKRDLAEKALGYLQEHDKLPDDMPGIWTALDDIALLASDAREVKRVTQKHGNSDADERHKFHMQMKALED